MNIINQYNSVDIIIIKYNVLYYKSFNEKSGILAWGNSLLNWGSKLVYSVILVEMWPPSTESSLASLNTETVYRGILQNVLPVPLFWHFCMTLRVLGPFQHREAGLEHRLRGKTPWRWILAELNFFSCTIFDYFVLLIYKMDMSACFTELLWRLNELTKAKI